MSFIDKMTSWSGLLVFPLVIGIGLAACHSVRVAPAVSDTPPATTTLVQTPVINVRGHFYGPRDTATVISGIDVVFSSRLNDSTVQRWRDVTKADGTYQVVVPAGRVYQIALNKDGLNIETQEFAVPAWQADRNSVVKNFSLSFYEPPDDYYQRKRWPTIYFDTKRTVLRPNAMCDLDTVANILRDEPRAKVVIEGHTDRSETPKGQSNPEQYLLHLGQARAAATLAYLLQQGAPASCLQMVSYGGRRPAAPSDTPENRQFNRRIEIKAVSVEGLDDNYSDLKHKIFRSIKQGQVRTVRGRVFSTQDSTTALPGVELVFRNGLADSTGPGYRTLTGPDGAYQVEVGTGLTYRVAIHKDGRPIGERSYSTSTTAADSSGMLHNFYVDYSIEHTDGYDGLPPMLFFDTNQAALRPESKTRLKNLIPVFKRNPEIGISIAGHAEPHEIPRSQTQADQYLTQLGQRRAQAAANYLLKRGVSANQIVVKSFGGEQLAAPNDSPENRQLNRRVEFKVLNLEAKPKIRPK